MEKRKVVFEFEECENGVTKCTAMGTKFKFEDLAAISDFAISMMGSFAEMHSKCFEAKYGKGENYNESNCK